MMRSFSKLDTRRCIDCGEPAVDHTPLRYVWRAWWRHRLLHLVNRVPLWRIHDTTAPF